MTALEVTFPTLLVATHLYCPLSPLVTLVIVNCLSSCDKLILPRTVTADPLTVHENVVGIGFPLASQDKVTFSPSFFVSFCGCVVMSGLSVSTK